MSDNSKNQSLSTSSENVKERQLTMLSGIVNQLQLVWLLFKDSRVSMFAKSVMPMSLLYTISPIDFIPDVILGFGQLDDLGVFLLGMALFVKLCPPDLVDYYRRKIEYGTENDNDDDTVDATFHVLDDE